MADDHHCLAIEAGQATDDRTVVGKGTITMQLMEIGEHQVDVVEGVGPLRMPGHLRNLPRRQLAVGLLDQRISLLLQTLDLVGDVDRRIILNEAQ
jgi:hypothetical protein